jgi:hypothetical protein
MLFYFQLQINPKIQNTFLSFNLICITFFLLILEIIMLTTSL